ncbi:MAG: glycosyltransferase family 4 protein [Nanoarchaeota archaeon]|nr:glycosyltransferase family 4 protein [Nanoarchaeota archaeon]
MKSNGVSRVVYDLATELSKRHDVSVAAYSHKIDKDLSKDVNVLPIKYSRFKYYNILNFKRVLKNNHPDILHSHTSLGISAKLVGIPYLSTYHGWGIFEDLLYGGGCFLVRLAYTLPVQYLSLKGADRVTTVSKLVKYRLKRVGITSKVIPNGVSNTFFNVSHKRNNLFRLLSVGTVSYRKGGHILFEVMKKLSKSHVVLDVVGRVGDRDIINNLNKLNNVYYWGVVRDIIDYYSTADVLLFPSLFESFGLVILEAMAAGLPVVAFDIPPMNELIVHEKTGMLIPQDKNYINSFANAILKLKEDESLYRRLSKNAKNFAKQFKWNKIAKLYEKEYKHVLNNH